LFNKPVVFVIGAGASYEVGLPLGIDLTRRVAEAMNVRESSLMRAMRAPTVGPAAAAANRLNRVLPTFDSIDEALHWLSDDPLAVELGKIGIADEIMKAERSSLLYNAVGDGRPDLAKVDATWLPILLSLLISGLKRTDADSVRRNVTFINFNYDRSLEHYLFWALQERASMEEDRSRSLVSSLDVIRPYGGLGKLWTAENSYGQTSDPKEISKRIRTFTEQRNEETGDQIQRAIHNSRVLVFLGFGFHSQNLDALTITSSDAYPRRDIFATVKNINHRNHSMLNQKLLNLTKSDGGSQVILEDLTANETLRNLKPSIIAAAN
jgi:hypothetical protein